GSPRRCSLAEAQRITRALRRKAELCGVFVNASLDEVAGVSEELGLTMLQMHGDEGPAFCAEAARRSGARVVKAAQVADAGDVRDLERFHVDFHLLDARPSQTQPQSPRGGTGETFDWSLARAHRSDVPLIVSGGLSAENVGEALAELEQAWAQAREDPAFGEQLAVLLRDFAGRPTPLYRARRMSEQLGWPVYLKREDLNHTGSHKLNNALGQALLAKRMGKRRVIAETGAGQHGVATATVCALLGMECVVYMGVEDTRRQRPNVQRMELLGATVKPVDAGAR